jgi:tellurite resistance protein
MTASEDDRFNLEVLKLLLQIAWGDGQVDPAEARMILGLGRSWSVPELELHELEKQLQSGKGLPAPSLGVLRARKQDVLEAARALANTDGHLGQDEKELLEEVESLLG